ncbi:MAG: isoprenylcysteine carboxylmethyltransferase family protein [Ignavibacteriaceae bacterium]|nr:isoprenylcysteine carboxylmethyltransferase family protein [Ignavibacteriaceae bacterium]
MDPINIIIGINILATFGANISGAKQGFKSSITQVKEKPKTYLQHLPTTLATVSLILLIISLFQIGTLQYEDKTFELRLIGLVFYLIFSWVQIWSFKLLGTNYSQDIVVLQKHQLVTKGIYSVVRHPHYLSQVIIEISAAAATLSYLVAPLALVQIPFLFLRAKREEQLLQKHFKQDFDAYKKKTGFFIPFLG